MKLYNLTYLIPSKFMCKGTLTGQQILQLADKNLFIVKIKYFGNFKILSFTEWTVFSRQREHFCVREEFVESSNSFKTSNSPICQGWSIGKSNAHSSGKLKNKIFSCRILISVLIKLPFTVQFWHQFDWFIIISNNCLTKLSSIDESESNTNSSSIWFRKDKTNSQTSCWWFEA